jgi:hypothetical protein
MLEMNLREKLEKRINNALGHIRRNKGKTTEELEVLEVNKGSQESH